MRQSDPPPPESTLPTSFQERGVAPPFTTPSLAGARLRDLGRDGPELVTPNPSGARGNYVLPWAQVRPQYRPSVHDIMLLTRLARGGRLDPAHARVMAWEVAREGFAGQAARFAAEAARTTDHARHRIALSLLWTALAEQLDQRGPTVASALARQQDAVAPRLARILSRPAAQIEAAVSELAAILAPFTLAPAPGAVETPEAATPPPRILRQIEQLQTTRDDMARQFEGRETDSARIGRLLVGAIDVILACAFSTLATARALLVDPRGLLASWFANPAAVTALATRTEWILDGWETICLLWRSAADTGARQAVLLEMAQLVPVLPRETLAWTDIKLPPEALDPPCRVISQNDDWRSGGGAVALIARNEALRAMRL